LRYALRLSDLVNNTKNVRIKTDFYGQTYLLQGDTLYEGINRQTSSNDPYYVEQFGRYFYISDCGLVDLPSNDNSPTETPAFSGTPIPADTSIDPIGTPVFSGTPIPADTSIEPSSTPAFSGTPVPSTETTIDVNGLFPEKGEWKLSNCKVMRSDYCGKEGVLGESLISIRCSRSVPSSVCCSAFEIGSGRKQIV